MCLAALLAQYLSIDGGRTNLRYYNPTYISAGDYADWNGATGSPFGSSAPGLAEAMTGADLAELAVIGWNLSTPAQGLAAQAAARAYAMA